MSISIELELSKKELNLDYRRLGYSFLKNLIKSENSEMYENLFSKDTNKEKNFTFWIHLPNPVFKSDCIIVDEQRMTINISSTDTLLLMIIFNSALKSKKTQFPVINNGSMIIKNVKSYKDKTIRESEIIITMLSPLVSRFHYEDRKDDYYIFNENGFESTIKNMAEKKYGEVGKNFGITPIKCKKVIVKAYGTNIPSSLGIFKLSGDIKMLNVMYLNGLGSKNGAGFGKFDIIG